MGDVGEDDLDTIRALLTDVQLGQFFSRIRDDLQVCGHVCTLDLANVQCISLIAVVAVVVFVVGGLVVQTPNQRLLG